MQDEDLNKERELSDVSVVKEQTYTVKLIEYSDGRHMMQRCCDGLMLMNCLVLLPIFSMS